MRQVAGVAGAAVAIAGTAAGAAFAGTHGPAPGAGKPRPARAAAPARQARAAAPARRASRAHAGRSVAAARTSRTSCTSVAHIGDSTSVDLISAAFLPSQAQRLQARYASVGVRHLNLDASGGRSIVEALPGQVNGYNVARAWRSQGFHGCWVFALGTNDTANVAAGSSVGYAARIDQMMSVAHGEPVMWVNTRTLLSTGPWSDANEQNWDRALVKALARYPTMRIFNWAAVAQPSWFLPDGIHYDSLGCAMRAKAIADALARAFPLGGQSTGRIVR
jgi:hypothetical protein